MNVPVLQAPLFIFPRDALVKTTIFKSSRLVNLGNVIKDWMSLSLLIFLIALVRSSTFPCFNFVLILIISNAISSLDPCIVQFN